jgi:hypothetical protein
VIEAIVIMAVMISVACALCAALSVTVIVSQRLQPGDVTLMLYTTLSFGIAAVALSVIAGLLWPA